MSERPDDPSTVSDTAADPPRSPPALGSFAPTMSLPDEKVLAQFGNYDILDEIARGGVGVVYRARQHGLNRIVALKVLQRGGAATSDQVQRFLQEAQSAAKLQHPNIVPIHDFGTFEGQHFFTMEFVEGESLADVVARGPIPPREALDMVRQTAEALHYAHTQGVVHRDVKPGNILIDRSGQLKVTDFGLAKEAANQQQQHLTVTGQVMGTPRYMSPEQASGKTAQADARSDIFSLGVTMYEMLTGRPAFEADDVLQVLQKILGEEPRPPHKVNPKVHRDVETICLKAIEKAPERRYQTAHEMTQDIMRFLAGEPIQAKARSALSRLMRRLRGYGKAILIYAVLLFITINGIVVALNARPSVLHLKSDTAKAAVLLNGLALTPEELHEGKKIRAGTHRVRVEAEPLFDPRETEFTTKPGEQRTMTITLPRRKGTMTIATDPPDAGVTITGEGGYHATFQGPAISQELPTGDYSLLVYKENYLAQDLEVSIETRKTQLLDFALLPINLWATPTSGSVSGVPAVGDFDGDGTLDVVIGDDDGKVYCFVARSGIPLWVFRTQNAVQAPITKADVTGDGRPEVIVGSTDHHLYCLNGNDGRQLWNYEAKGAIVGAALLKDVTGDGLPDVFVGSDDGNLYAVSGNEGKLLWKFTTKGRIDSCLAWTRDGEEDVLLVGSMDRTLYALRPRTGELLWKVDVGAPLQFPPRIEDIEQNKKPWVLLPTPRTSGDARTRTAVSLAERKVMGASDTYPRWVDLDGDGVAEKIVVGAQGTECYAPDGKTLRWAAPHLAVSAYLADVNGDRTLDLVFNNGPDQLLCLSGSDGRVIGRIVLDAPCARGYALDDVDRDSVPDVIVGVGRKMYCYSWVGGRPQWMARGESYYDAAFAQDASRVFVKTVSGQIACYDPERRMPLWKLETSPQPSPYVGVAAGQGMVVDADAHKRLLAVFQAADGKLIWSAKLPGTADASIGWPAIVEDMIVVSDGDTGLYCFALADGKPRWQQAVPKVMARAETDGTKLFVVDDVNTLRCLSLKDGVEKWKFAVSDPFSAAPSLVDLNADGVRDAVVFSGNGYIYALDGKTGTQLWEYKAVNARTRTRNRLLLADVTGDGFPEGILGTQLGDVTGLDLRQHTPLWKFALGEQILSEPAMADVNGDGVADIVVGTMNRRVHCLSGKGDRKLWTYEVGAQVRYCVPLLVKTSRCAYAPRVMIGTGPPENGLYCLAGEAPRPNALDWFSPWKWLTSAR